MKYIILILLAGSFLFSGCGSIPKIHKTYNKTESANISNDVPLMPFFGNEKFGYVNSETFEIVIPEQYYHATHFVGDFGVVAKEKGKHYVINRNNEKILSGFDYIQLFNNENGEMVFALTSNNADYYLGTKDIGIISVWQSRSESNIYRLYNLTTGKLVMEMGKDRHDIPKVRFFGNYIAYETGPSYSRSVRDIYEIQNDGSLVKSTITFKELISKIVMEKHLQYNEMDFEYYRGLDTRNDWFGYFNTFDIDKLIEQLPDGMEIIKEKIYKNNKPILRIEFLEDIMYPLKDTLFFNVYLKYRDEPYTGLYNASVNEWLIPPVKGYKDFLKSEYPNWVIDYHTWIENENDSGYGNIFYNIVTRKKYLYFFALKTYGSSGYRGAALDSYYKIMYRIGWKREPIIEDF